MPVQEVPPYQVVIDSFSNAPLKCVFLIHFILTTWAVQGYWSPDSYFFYNIIFFFTLFWSIHCKDSDDPVLLCLIIDLLAILFDVITLAVYFPHYGSGGSEKYSVAMAILNLVARPISCLVLHKVWKERHTPNFMTGNRGQGGRSYQDMESPNQSIPG